MELKAEGIIQITEDLRLNNPIMEIDRVTYDWSSDEVKISIIFTEGINGIYKHERDFLFTNTTGGELSVSDIIQWLSNHEVLKTFFN